jgi:hypothetical protein
LKCSPITEPITIDDRVWEIKERGKYQCGKTPIKDGTHFCQDAQRCHKCWGKAHCDWKIVIKEHSLLSLIGILRERKLREQALAAGSGSVLESGMIEDQVMPALPPLPSAAVNPYSNGYAHISVVEI